MEKIKRIFDCKLCDKQLSECILLPCGDSVCKMHIKNVQKIRCLSCSNEHEVPTDGFPLNKVANQLIESNFHKLDFGNDFNDAEKACLKLEERLKLLFKIFEKPCEYFSQFFKKMIQAFDLKREEIKLENHKYAENLINTFDSSELIIDNSKAKKIELVCFYLEKANIKSCQNNSESELSNLVCQAKNEIDQKIDNHYLNFIDELNSKMNLSIDGLEINEDILETSYREQISIISSYFNRIDDEIKKFKFKDKDFTDIKKKLKIYQDQVNKIIRYTKNKLVFSKGFDFESKFYHFPYLDNLEFLKNKKHDFEINVESCLISDLEPFDSEKFVVNGIKFHVSLKILMNKIGGLSYSGRLICENPFDFSAIEVWYSMQLTPYMNKPKAKKSFIKYYAPNCIKLTPLKVI